VEKFHFAIKADAQFLSNPIDLWRRSPPVVIEQLQKLKYIGGIAKNRNILVKTPSNQLEKIRVDEYAQWLSAREFKEIQIQGEKPRTVWVAIIEAEISKLEGIRKIAIVMSAPDFEDAEDIDYLITNVEGEKVTQQWIVDTYSERNWVEVFYREAKGWLGLKPTFRTPTCSAELFWFWL
jgi:hypothetical protein